MLRSLRYTPSAWRRALLVSCGVHGLLFGAAGWVGTSELSAPRFLLVRTAAGSISSRGNPQTNSEETPLPSVPVKVHLAETSPEVAAVAAPLVRERFAEAVTAADRQAPDEKLAQLTEMSRRLTQIGDAQSLEKLAGFFQRWMGLDPYAPLSVESRHPFDPHTAQFHEIRRTSAADGSWTYEAVLVDRNGQTMTVSLAPAEGEPLYRVLEQVRQNPLLEQVYRAIAMPLLQRLVAELPPFDSADSAPSASSTVPRDEPASRGPSPGSPRSVPSIPTGDPP